MNKFVEIRRDLHKIPEVGFQELKTQQYLLDYIVTLPQERLTVKKWKTGLFVFVEGTMPTKIIAYRTDIDGLPIQEETGLPFASEHQGFMHACGHDFHMAIALGVLTNIIHHPPANHSLFIFQPAEESPGGAKEMIKSDILKEWWPDQILGLHIAPELPVGTVGTKTGLLFANTSELFIDFKGLGGHAAYPHRAVDMVVIAAQFVTQLQTIVSRNSNPLDSVVITVGKMTAGTANNIIAETARLEGTIRTLSAKSMENVRKRIEEMVRGYQISYNCEITIDYGSSYYHVDNDVQLTEEFIDFVKKQDGFVFAQSEMAMTGEDFGFFLKEIPGLMFWLGVNSNHGLHHAKLNPDEAAIDKAIKLITIYFNQ